MRKNIETFCVHPFNDVITEGTGVTPPIFKSTSYGYFEGSELIYPGFLSTPNQLRLAQIMTELERGEWGIVLSSGMSAISVAMLAFLKSGDHIILSNELYGGTMNFVADSLSKLGISHSFAEPTIEAFQNQIRPETKVIFIETPSNPSLSVFPLRDIAALARKQGIVTMVDNTIASSINQCPIESGIDISIQSGTKYLGGHNDLQFGTLVCRDKAMTPEIMRVARLFGGALAPDHCYEAEKNLKTLALRVSKQNENGNAVADFLSQHAMISKVYYPGLTSHPRHDVAVNQMKGFGGLMSFDVKTDAAGVNLFLKALKIIKPALSFGGLDSVICLPSKTSHRGLTPEQRNKLGIKDTMVRVSAGIEHVEDIIKDLDDALRMLTA